MLSATHSRLIPHRLILIAVLFVFPLLASQPTVAQIFRGSIRGSVTDPSGAVIVNAKVIASDSGTSQSYAAASASDGVYSFQDLPIGTYTVLVNVPGYSSVEISSIRVQAGAVYSLPIRLQIFSAAQSVQVNANDLSLDTATITNTAVIDTKAVQNIPLNGRDFTQLANLTPGYSGYSSGFGSVNGSRYSQLNWQIEGADSNDVFANNPATNQGGVRGIPGVVFPLDAVDEFSATTLSGSETGRNSGATINVTIKSGTNQLHGSIYYYNRNEALAEPSPFLQSGSPKQKLRNDQRGFSVGGPIWKDHTFFFAAYERQAFIVGSSQQATGPSQLYQAAAKSLLNAYNVPVNTASINLLNNLWPASALTGPASSGNYQNPGDETGYSNNGLVKLDHAFNDRNRSSIRGFIGQGSQTAPTSSVLTPYFEVAPMKVQNWAAIHDTIITPQLSNHALFGFNFFRQTYSDKDHSYDPISLGLNTGVTNPQLSGAPRINITGFDPIGIKPYSGREDITAHIDDTIAYSVHSHEFRFGGEVRRGQVYDFYHAGQRGTFNFTGGQGPWSGTSGLDSNVAALADFLAGYVATSNIVLGDPVRRVAINSFALFGQDNWQVSRKLNLNLGLRYDVSGPLHSNQNNVSTFDPARGGLVLAGVGIGSLYPKSWTNVSPRIGFVYHPAENGGLVVRGSAGIFYDNVYVSPFLADNPFNGGPSGVQGNPIGSNPVESEVKNNYTIVPGQQIFDSKIAILPTSVYPLFSVSQSFRMPYTYKAGLNIEKSLGKSSLAQLGYVGSFGRKQIAVSDINQSALGSAAKVDANGNNITRPYYTGFSQYSNINQLSSWGSSNYNSLQALLRTSNWHRLTSQVSYVWAHALDNGSGAGLLRYPQNSNDLADEYGNSDFDNRHVLTATIFYDLPGFNHGPKWLSHGWSLNSIVSLHSGSPFTLFSIFDGSGTGENTDRVTKIGNPYAGVSHKIVNHQSFAWVNYQSFTQAYPDTGTYGTFRRNQLAGPGFSDVDLSVIKNTHISERVSAQFRIEAFNLFNRVNLANPTWLGSNYLIPAAGETAAITTTSGDQFGLPGLGPGEPLNVQLALKVIF